MPDERDKCGALINRYSTDACVKEEWETFCVYTLDDPDYKLRDPNYIFYGATKLPLEVEEEFFTALQHWCSLLTEIRKSLRNVRWRVTLDGDLIAWDEEKETYIT